MCADPGAAGAACSSRATAQTQWQRRIPLVLARDWTGCLHAKDEQLCEATCSHEQQELLRCNVCCPGAALSTCINTGTGHVKCSCEGCGGKPVQPMLTRTCTYVALQMHTAQGRARKAGRPWRQEAESHPSDSANSPSSGRRWWQALQCFAASRTRVKAAVQEGAGACDSAHRTVRGRPSHALTGNSIAPGGFDWQPGMPCKWYTWLTRPDNPWLQCNFPTLCRRLRPGPRCPCRG